VKDGSYLRRGFYRQSPDIGVECLSIVCLSGPAAEELCCGPITDHGDRIDRQMARGYLRERYSEAQSNACRRTAQVFTIELDQIEGAQDGGMVVAPGSRQVKGGEAAFVDHDGPPSIKHDSTGRLSRAAAIRGKRVARL